MSVEEDLRAIEEDLRAIEEGLDRRDAEIARLRARITELEVRLSRAERVCESEQALQDWLKSRGTIFDSDGQRLNGEIADALAAWRESK